MGVKNVSCPENGDKSNSSIHPLPAAMVAALQYLIQLLLGILIALVVVASTFNILWKSSKECTLLVGR